MNMQDLIDQTATLGNMDKATAKCALAAMSVAIVIELTKGGEVTLPGLGKLTVKDRAARKGRNPATGAEMVIAAKKVPHFKPVKALNDAINANA